MTISSAKPDPTKRNWSDLNFATIAWALIVGPLVPFGLFALPALLLAGWIFLIVLAIGGALVALVSYYGSDISLRLENTTDVPPVANALQLAAAAGIIGGLAYWLIAGRNAGRRRETPSPPE